MSITAVIENGVIKLPKDVPWKSGTIVRIEPVDEQSPKGGNSRRKVTQRNGRFLLRL